MPAEPAGERVPVLLLIGSLEHGGAQRQLVELARRLDRSRFEPLIGSLSTNIPLASALPHGMTVAVAARRWRFDLPPVLQVTGRRRDIPCRRRRAARAADGMCPGAAFPARSAPRP